MTLTVTSAFFAGLLIGALAVVAVMYVLDRFDDLDYLGDDEGEEA